jgi:hypothetical protein
VFRPLTLALGAFWLGLLVASWFAATSSFRTVDRVLGPSLRPEFATRLQGVPEAERRVVFRYLASEINRGMFRRFGFVEAAFALALAALAWPGGGKGRIFALAIVVVVLGQLVFLGPQILALGRSIDFVPRPLPPDVARTFGLLHGAYLVFDLLKAGLLASVCWLAARP